MDRKDYFFVFAKTCKDKRQYCGSGNPYSNILLIGQEPHSKKNLRDNNEQSNQEWKNYVDLNYRYCVEDNPWIENGDRWREKLFQNNSKTWFHYQRLIDASLPNRLKRAGRGERDFEFDAFTSELNNEKKQSSTTHGKDEREKVDERVSSRLIIFESSKFIQEFPVVVLACGGYLTNQVEKGIMQINDTFHVKFDDPDGRFKFENGRPWFTTHHSSDRTRLVIHTCQFSLNHFTGEEQEWLITKMASEINNHLKKLGLI